jgi:hypothetical protein
MERLDEYRHLLMRLMSDYAEFAHQHSRSSGVDTYLVFDTARDHYLMLRLGWSDDSRIRNLILFVRLHEGKFWIEEDWTEAGIATDLLKAGISKENIVLAFHPPEMRGLSEFAAA